MGIKFESPRVGTFISKTNKANAMSTQSTKSKFRRTDNRTTRPEVVTQGSLDCPARVPQHSRIRQPYRDPHPRMSCITTQPLFTPLCPPESDLGQALNPVPWRHFLPNQPETKHAPELTVAFRKETVIKVTPGTDLPALLSR